MTNAPSRNTARKLVFLTGASYFLLILFISLTAFELPTRIASHFNPGGEPDGWLNRDRYLLWASLLALLLPPLPSISFYALRWLPERWLRLPAGWAITPERRHRTLHELLTFGLGASLILLLVQASLHLAVLIANLANPSHLANWLKLLPLRIVSFSFPLWFIRISRYFKNPPIPGAE